MKQKLYKELDSNYYIQTCQYSPEYQHFYEIKKKGWLWDSLVIWSLSLEAVKDYYDKVVENSKHYKSL